MVPSKNEYYDSFLVWWKNANQTVGISNVLNITIKRRLLPLMLVTFTNAI